MPSAQERIEQTKHHEESRKLLSNISFIRNRSYWRELRKLQKERLNDSEILLYYYKEKFSMMKELNSQWKSAEFKMRQKYETQIKNLNGQQQSLGLFTCNILIEMESSLLKITNETIEFFEKEVILPFQEKLANHLKDLSLLWDEGKKLLIAWNLMDSRVHQYYNELIQALSLNNNSSSAANDIWLCQMKYNESYRRYTRVDESCNNQFRILFGLAKQLETSRIQLTTRFAEKFIHQFGEATTFAGLQKKNASGLPILR
jgi:hypothetical protein